MAPPLRLGTVRQRLPSVPLLALTATAVPRVRGDVARSLALGRLPTDEEDAMASAEEAEAEAEGGVCAPPLPPRGARCERLAARPHRDGYSSRFR